MKKLLVLAFVSLCFAWSTRADLIQQFNIDATPVYTIGEVMGTLTVDVTTGVATSINFAREGFDPSFFSTIYQSSTLNGGWQIASTSSGDRWFWMEFTTTEPNSLVGFTGGRILDGYIIYSVNDNLIDSALLGGTITDPPVETPEPKTIFLLGLGIGWTLLCLRIGRSWLLSPPEHGVKDMPDPNPLEYPFQEEINLPPRQSGDTQ